MFWGITKWRLLCQSLGLSPVQCIIVSRECENCRMSQRKKSQSCVCYHSKWKWKLEVHGNHKLYLFSLGEFHIFGNLMYFVCFVCFVSLQRLGILNLRQFSQSFEKFSAFFSLITQSWIIVNYLSHNNHEFKTVICLRKYVWMN